MADKEALKKIIEDGTFSAADLSLYYDIFVEMANQSEEVQKLMEGWDRKFQWSIGGSSDFWLKIEMGKIAWGMGKIENPDLTYSASEENALKMFTGEADGTSLYVTQQLKIEGNIGDAQKMGGIQTTIIGQLDITLPSKTEEITDPNLLTEEDNQKITASLTAKAATLAKGATMVADLLEGGNYTIALRMEEFAKNIPDNIALMYEDQKWTHREFNEECNRYSNFFRDEIGLKLGDVVVVDLENRPEIMFVLIAMAKIGVISSLINTNQRKKPLIHSIKHSDGKVFIIGEEMVEAFEEVRNDLELDEHQAKNVFYLIDKGKMPIPKGFKDLKNELKKANITNPSTTKEILTSAPYAYIFTSGTTGLPKAALINSTHTLMGMSWWGFMVCDMTPEDIFFITSPIYHSNAINVAFAACLAYGSTMVISRKFSVSKFWEEANKYKCTIFNYVGEILRYLYNAPPKPGDKNNTIKKIVGNGLRLDIWKGFKERFGIEKVCEFYGATERFYPNFANVHNIDLTIGTCFTPFAIVKYDIEKDEPVKDENGHMIRITVGESGLLLGLVPEADAPTYYMYKDPKASEKKVFRNVFEEGDMYINTSDLLKDIGYNHFQFVDRLGDTFRWKGENVSTEEVEAVVNTFGPISMSCAYGVLIPNTEGRAGMVSIVKNEYDENFDLNDFYELLKKYLPEYAIPKFLRFKKEFEVTGTLKIKKGNLKTDSYEMSKIDDPMYILLPGASEYVKLTEDIFTGIKQGKYRF